MSSAKALAVLVIASRCRNMPLGAAKRKITVAGSGASTRTGWPPAEKNAGVAGVSSRLSSTSSYQNMMSRDVKGRPSDHFIPLRRRKVNTVSSALAS
jgi:hypothetical protein